MGIDALVCGLRQRAKVVGLMVALSAGCNDKAPPKYYDTIDEPSPCALTYTEKNPQTHDIERHVLQNLKVVLYNSRKTSYFLNDSLELHGEPNRMRIPLETIDTIQSRGNTRYDIEGKNESMYDISLYDFTFVGYILDGKPVWMRITEDVNVVGVMKIKCEH